MIEQPRLRVSERHAAENILNRIHADPDDDAAVVARAALRLGAAARPLDVEALVAHVERVKRSPRKSNAEWQPEDISFDVGVAAAQDAIRNYARRSQPGGSDAE